MLSHFLSKRTRSSRSKDPYLALATRLAIDLYLTHSLSRFTLTCAWTLLGLLLADVAPGIWRDSGLKSVYKAFRRELRAIRKVIPRWKIKNDLRVPKISLKNPVPGLFFRPPPSSVASSTRAAPPASPVPLPTHKRRTPPGTYPGHSALSETNTDVSRLREVLPGPSPALIPTAADPAYRSPPFDLQSQPISSDPIMNPDDNWVHVSDIDVPPLTFEVGIQTTNIASPSPYTRITSLPRIPNSDMDEPIPAHQVPLPESRPASVVGSVLSLFGARRVLSLARGDKATSDVGVDSTQHRAISDGQRPALGSAAGPAYNQPSTIGHHRIGSGPGPSMLRHADDDDDDESVMRGARTEPMFGGKSESLLGAGEAAFVGGLAVELRDGPAAFVDGFEAETTNQVESFIGGFAAESGSSQPLSVPREFSVPAQNSLANPSQTSTPIQDAPTTTAMNVNVHSNIDNNSATNINTTTDETPAHNVDNLASAPNPSSQKQEKSGKPEGGRKKKGPKNTTPVPSKSVTPAPPETTSQNQQHTSSDVQQGPDLQNLTDPAQDEAIAVQNSGRPSLGMDMSTYATGNGHAREVQGPDFPDGNPDSPPPPFQEVATPIEPTLLTQEQTDRESLRGEFLMRELKHLEALVSKAEGGVTRGSPSALSVERLNGIKERLVRVRMRVERRVYEGAFFFGSDICLATMLIFFFVRADAPAEIPIPPQLTLSGIDGLSAVDLVHTAIVDMLLETLHAEPLAVVGYMNKQKKPNPRVVETKTAVVDWVKE